MPKKAKRKKTAYFIGIKGAGMTALAQVFKKEGYLVLGSDVKEEFFTDKILKKAKIKVFEGFSEKNLPKSADIYISSNAYLAKNVKNPEIIALKKAKKKIYSYPQALAYIFNEKFGIGVAGTHGKSTTTSMLGLILKEAKLKPNVLVGAEVLNWQSNVYLGGGKIFLIEADEYKGAFLNYKPKAEIINSIEYDHTDYFKTEKGYNKTFKKFVSHLKEGGFLVCFREVREKLFCKVKKAKVKRLSKLKKSQDYKIIDVLNKKGKIIRSYYFLTGQRRGIYQSFKILNKKKEFNFSLRVGGVYLFNAALAAVLALELGIKPEVVRRALRNYKGTGRRFEIITKKRNFVLVDDFAHHPTAIKETISLAKKVFPKRKIVAVFQSHTYTRTEKFLKGFVDSLKEADKAIILPIFGSAREKKGKVKAKDIYNLLEKEKSFLAKDFKEAASLVKKITSENKKEKFAVLLLGAGDIYKVKEFFV